MTLLTQHIEAGWHEVEVAVGKAAERILSRPGATSSIIRVEAETQSLLHDAINLRESQLVGASEPIRDTITSDGSLVTGDQHEALSVEGLVVADPSEAPATEQEVDSSSSSEPTSESPVVSPEPTSIDSPATV